MTPITFDRWFMGFFAAVAFLSVMAYIAACTFFPMPSTGIKYADIAVPSLLSGVIGGIIGYLYGASKTQTPPPATAPATTAITVTEARPKP